jgi:uncharacterized protein YwqG
MQTAFTTAADIERSLRAAGADIADARAIAARAKPCVWLETIPAANEGEVAIGVTKIGGVPDLPGSLTWPWRAAYPDYAQRVAEVEAGVALFAPAELATGYDETLAELKRLLPEHYASDEAAPDFSALHLEDLVEKARKTAQPAPLAFIAQIDLAAAWNAGPLDPDIPREGRLLFFYDTHHQPGGDKPADNVGARLIHDVTPIGALRRAAPPPALAELEDGCFPSLRCVPHAGLAPPFYGTAELDACAIRENSDKALRSWWNAITPDGRDHRIGGHPAQIQGDMAMQCALLRSGRSFEEIGQDVLNTQAADWLLLLQISSDRNARMKWGDVGNLYVWIHRDALRARRFDEARVFLQGY